ncbi:sugar lactone lactonase YvrE [Kribbella steppae]|uniref:Sugar lactone lactonase YvrE n=1 Tax=Kribbella steppae TaxID=2512223 RepID=A0A4R2HN77_9ACTN|nr:SMP-30/gluconolactonase/LRE family protein [Kribbella steppae]TCO30564.1 sugar lactone lactonase YvrE [Kribbella steppae]
MAEILLEGLVIGESARWHDGRLWCSNWGAQEILAVDASGKREVMARVPTTLPFSIDWLPDGRLLVVSGPEGLLLRQEASGDLVTHADMSSYGGLNEIVVDGRGNVYVNGGCDFQPGEGERPGFILLLTPDGSVRRVADELAFPNGMVITPDNSILIIAESFGGVLTAYDIAGDGSLSNRRVWAPHPGDGMCMDESGAIWTPGWTEQGESACLRIAEGGEILETVPLEHAGFACTLGDGTLYMLTADWHMQESFDANLDRLLSTATGRVLTHDVHIPKAGWP